MSKRDRSRSGDGEETERSEDSCPVSAVDRELQGQEADSVVVPPTGGEVMPLGPGPQYDDHEQRREAQEAWDMLAAVLQQDACGLTAVEATRVLSDAGFAARWLHRSMICPPPRVEDLHEVAFDRWWELSGRKKATALRAKYRKRLDPDLVMHEVEQAARMALRSYNLDKGPPFDFWAQLNMNSAVVGLNRKDERHSSRRADLPDDASTTADEGPQRHLSVVETGYDAIDMNDFQERVAMPPEVSKRLIDGDSWKSIDGADTAGDAARRRVGRWVEANLRRVRRTFLDDSS